MQHKQNTNNTNTEPTISSYINKGIQTYAGTDTWDATPPSGSSTKQYQWIQKGKNVQVWIWLTYATGGTSNTTIDISWPADLPLPIEPGGRTGTNDVIFAGVGRMNNSTSATAGTVRGGYIIKTGTGTYKLQVVAPALNAKTGDIYISYIAV